MIASWPAPLPSGKISEELLLSFDEGRATRILILPALFDEANKMRRFTVQVMRKLDAAGIDSFLPDLPGCNESTLPLQDQSIADWRAASNAAAGHVRATHFLTLRGGALNAPAHLPGWHYAPQTGAKVLRTMLRARVLSAKEAGIEETSEQLLEAGRGAGLTLAGWPIGAAMLRELETAEPHASDAVSEIAHKTLRDAGGGVGLWLRAEPSEDEAQASALADILADALAGASADPSPGNLANDAEPGA